MGMLLTVDKGILKINLGFVEYKLKQSGDKFVLFSVKGKHECLAPNCDGEVYPHRIGSVHVALNGFAVDVEFKCSKCNLWFIRGIHLDRDTYYKVLSMAHKWVIFDEKFKDIYERLEKLGYW